MLDDAVEIIDQKVSFSSLAAEIQLKSLKCAD